MSIKLFAHAAIARSAYRLAPGLAEVSQFDWLGLVQAPALAAQGARRATLDVEDHAIPSLEFSHSIDGGSTAASWVR